MRYVYNKGEVDIVVDEDVIGTLSEQPTAWKNNIPHPDSDLFDEFQVILLQLSTPDEREILLHIVSGNIEWVGFPSQNDES